MSPREERDTALNAVERQLADLEAALVRLRLTLVAMTEAEAIAS